MTCSPLGHLPSNRFYRITMDLERVPPPVIEDSSLTDWASIGFGGFGQIFKARHQRWCDYVAIKLLHYG